MVSGNLQWTTASNPCKGVKILPVHLHVIGHRHDKPLGLSSLLLIGTDLIYGLMLRQVLASENILTELLLLGVCSTKGQDSWITSKLHNGKDVPD